MARPAEHGSQRRGDAHAARPGAGEVERVGAELQLREAAEHVQRHACVPRQVGLQLGQAVGQRDRVLAVHGTEQRVDRHVEVAARCQPDQVVCRAGAVVEAHVEVAVATAAAAAAVATAAAAAAAAAAAVVVAAAAAATAAAAVVVAVAVVVVVVVVVVVPRSSKIKIFSFCFLEVAVTTKRLSRQTF